MLPAHNKLTPTFGERHGRLFVLGEGEPYVLPSGRREVTAITFCDCGVISTKLYKYLRKGLTTSCGNHRKGVALKEKVTYYQAHQRGRTAKGKASEWACVDCGRDAHHWSYNGQDPDELYGKASHHRDTLSAYSVNPDYYEPRCASCHQYFDADLKAAR